MQTLSYPNIENWVKMYRLSEAVEARRVQFVSFSNDRSYYSCVSDALLQLMYHIHI